MPTTIPERLLDVREAEGLALRPFAERLATAGFPISAATVGGYENGRTEKVPADYVAAVCRVFGTSPAWLLSGEGPVRQPSPEEAVARLEAVRVAMEAPLPEAHQSPTGEPAAATVDVQEGADVLIELVSAFEELIPDGAQTRRADAVRIADYIATRLADAQILPQADRQVWQTYMAGAAPGPGGIPPETILTEILGAEAHVRGDLQRLLYAVGERLHDASNYGLAASCQGLAVQVSEQTGDLGSACDAALRKARCHKLSADWAEAVSWYERAMRWAERLDDWERYGVALSGLASLRADQGSMADSKRIAERLLALGQERNLPRCVAMAHHALSVVAYHAGRLEDGIWHGWQAAVTYPEKNQNPRLRALFMTGTCLLHAGHASAAEDAYRVAAAGIKDVSTRLLALSALAYAAAVLGDGEEYDRRLEHLERNSEDHVSRRDRAQVAFDQAKAHAILGRLDEARRRFQEARLFAERHGFNREAIQADEALALLESGTNPWAPPEPMPTDGRLDEVVVGLREMVGAGQVGVEAPLPAAQAWPAVDPTVDPTVAVAPDRTVDPTVELADAPTAGMVDMRPGTDVLIELVSAFEELIPDDRETRRADAVRVVDHIATRLADSRLLARADHQVWRTYFAGAAPGLGERAPEAILAEVLDGDEQIGGELQRLLYAVGERMHDASAYGLAAAFHGLAFSASERAGDLPSACDAAVRRARCHKLAGEWSEAIEWYDRSMSFAERLDDWERCGKALDGLGWLRSDQGSMADAQKIAERLLALGKERNLPICVAQAHHSLCAVAHIAGRLEDGIWHGWKAAVTHPGEEERLRSVFSTGTCLLDSGHILAAEDAYRLAAAAIKEISVRLLAMSALAYISAIRGDADEYDHRLERLEADIGDHVSHRDRAQIAYFQAKAHAMLGRLDEARGRFQDARLFAERHGFNRQAIQADEALALLQSGTNPWPRPEPIPTTSRLEEVGAGLRKMVETGSF